MKIHLYCAKQNDGYFFYNRISGPNIRIVVIVQIIVENRRVEYTYVGMVSVGTELELE